MSDAGLKVSIKELLKDFPASIVCTKEIYDEISYVCFHYFNWRKLPSSIYNIFIQCLHEYLQQDYFEWSQQSVKYIIFHCHSATSKREKLRITIELAFSTYYAWYGDEIKTLLYSECKKYIGGKKFPERFENQYENERIRLIV